MTLVPDLLKNINTSSVALLMGGHKTSISYSEPNSENGRVCLQLVEGDRTVWLLYPSIKGVHVTFVIRADLALNTGLAKHQFSPRLKVTASWATGMGR